MKRRARDKQEKQGWLRRRFLSLVLVVALVTGLPGLCSLPAQAALQGMPGLAGLSKLLDLPVLSGLQVETAYAADDEPKVHGEAAIIYCATTGEVVWEKNADEELNPASITKLLTCLLAIEKLPLDKEVTITKEATQVIPSMIYLQVGEVITVEELLYAALLQSANDAAAALAIETAGSIEDFAKMMNQRAAAIGCTHTSFENPHGLQGEAHYASARDIALISAEAFSNETLRKIAGTPEHTIPATNASPERNLKNGNLFLRGGEVHTDKGTVSVLKHEEVFGGKTGTTEQNVATMTVGMEYDDLEIYMVVLGTTLYRRYLDERALMDYAKENVSKYVVFEEGETFDPGKLTHGATNRVTGKAAEAGYIRLPEGASESLISVKAVYNEDLKAPIKAGDTIGKVEIYLADEKMQEVPMVAAGAVKEGWFLSPLGITNVQTIVIVAILVLVVVAVVGLFVLRAVNLNRRRKRRRRRVLELARRQLEQENSWKQRDWPY